MAVDPTTIPQTKVTVVNEPVSPSAWDHAALLLGAIILVGAAVFDSYHSLSSVDWGAIGVAVAGLGIKGTLGVPAP